MSAGTRSTHRFLARRAVLIGLPITDELAADFLDALSLLERRGSDPITIYVNSPGGAVPAAEKIIRGMRGSPLETRTFCVGWAAGAAAHLFAAGRRRGVLSQAKISFLDFRETGPNDPARSAELRRRFAEGTSTDLGVPLETVVGWMRDERSFVGIESVDAGIAHESVVSLA